jgi:cystathionine beta-synthase
LSRLGGTISGIGRYLKKNPNIKIWEIDTYGSVLKIPRNRYFDESEIYSYITENWKIYYLKMWTLIDGLQKTDKRCLQFIQER